MVEGLQYMYEQRISWSITPQDPVKVKPWENILDATVGKEGCLQFSLTDKKIAGSEDCLYNNIHTRQVLMLSFILNK